MDKDKYRELGKQFEKDITENPDDIIKFIKTTKYKYYVIEDLFTDQLADLFSKLDKNFIFCSDIRTAVIEEGSAQDFDIVWNSAMQHNWIKKMDPARIMLKFRCPFYNNRDKFGFFKKIYQEPFKTHFKLAKNNGIDFVTNYKNHVFKYYKPDKIYIQSFPGVESTETRLVVSRGGYDNIITYNTKEYEDKFFYYNRVHRSYGFHDEHKDVFDKSIGFDACGDCALMYKIFKDYYEKYEPKNCNPLYIKKSIDNLLNVIRRNLREKDTMHGSFVKPFANVQTAIDQQKSLIGYGIYKQYASLLENNAIVIE
jgi:hypothetical protein